MPALDGLRAIAVVAVLLYHADVDWIPGGFLGVDVFFVLSGFLITSLLLAEMGGRRYVDLKAFYLRRARRLLPALYLVLVGSVVLGVTIALDAAAQLQRDVPAALAYVTNWVYVVTEQSYFDAVGRPPMLEHLWSLAIEEQFYLLWPIALVFLFRRGGRPMVRRWALIGAALSTAWMAILSIRNGYPVPADPSRVYFGTDSHAMGLLAGAAFATIWRPRANSARLTWEARAGMESVGAIGLIVLGLAFWQVDQYSPLLYRGGFLAIAGLVVVILASVTQPSSWIGHALGRQPLKYLGERSYGLYLWHWPVFVVTRPGVDVPIEGWANTVLRLGLTMALAEASYRLVEIPIRRDGVRSWWSSVVRQIGSWGSAGRAIGARPGLILVAMVLLLSGLAWRLYSIEPAQEPDYLGGISALSAIPDGATIIAPASPIKPSQEQDQPAPSEPAPRQPDGYLGVGESVMIGAAPTLEKSFSPLAIDAEVGRQPSEIPGRLAELARSDALRDTVVVHSGSNGPVIGSELRDSVRALEQAGVSRVVLINISVPRRWEANNNELIAKIAGEFEFAEMADWKAAVAGDPGLVVEDKIHLSNSGMREYVRLIKEALSRIDRRLQAEDSSESPGDAGATSSAATQDAASAD